MAKKSSVKKQSSKFTKDAPTEKYFVLCNGQRIRNLKELAMMIDSEPKLAKDISSLKDKTQLRKKLYDHFGERY
jgi:hypothetical protein